MKKAERIRIRKKLIDADPHCFWCGVEFPLFLEVMNGPEILITPEIRKKNLMDIPTLEHILSNSKYERDFERNLRLACFGCNR